MEETIMKIIAEGGSAALGTMAVVYFGWRKLGEVCEGMKELLRLQTIILTRMGEYDAKKAAK